MALSQKELDQMLDNAVAAQQQMSPYEAYMAQFAPPSVAQEPEEPSALASVGNTILRLPGQVAAGFGNALIGSTLTPLAAIHDYIAGEGDQLSLPARAVQEAQQLITDKTGGPAENFVESTGQGVGNMAGYMLTGAALGSLLGPIGTAIGGAGGGIVGTLLANSPRIAAAVRAAAPMIRAGLMEGAAEGGQTYLDRFESSGANRNAAMRAALGNTAMNVPINVATSALGYGVGNRLTRDAAARGLGHLMERQAAERAADRATSGLSAFLSEGAQETAQNLSSQYWGGDQPLSEVLSGENIGAQMGDAGSVGGAVGLITNMLQRGLGARQLRRAARGLPDDASVNASIEQLQAREDAGTNQQVIDALAALQAQRQALTDYNQSGYTDVRLDAINRAMDNGSSAQKILQALQEQDNAAQAQQQETQAAEQTQAETQQEQTAQTETPKAEATTDVQTLLNGVNSDLERVEGILAENTDQRTVDAFTRYRARLSRAQTALNSAAEMKTGKKKAENIESAKRDIESANEIIYAFRDMLAPASQSQQSQTAQNPQVQNATTPAPTQTQAPASTAQQPQPTTGNEARIQFLNEMIAKRESELDGKLKKSKGKHTPAVKQLNALIKDLRNELEEYQTAAAPEAQTTTAQPKQTEIPMPPASTTTDEQTAPAPAAPATSETPTDTGELLLAPSPRVIEDAQVEADKANREIEAINARLQGLSPDDRRVGTLEDKRSNAEARRQRAENLMRPQRVSRLRPEAIVADFNVPVGRLNAARKANSDYLNATLVRPLRDLRDLLVRTKMGKYEKNAVNVVDKVIRGIELHGNAGMSSQDALDFFSSVSSRIGANTPNGRMIAHSANNIAKLLAYPDVQTALRNLNEINQRIASSTKTGVTYHRDNNSAAFQAQERMLSQERMNDIIEREGQPEQTAPEAVSIPPEETTAAAPQSAPIQPPTPIPADRRQEGTISDPQEAELRAGAREARRQEQVSAARQTVADDAARRDRAVMERASSVQLPEGTVNLNLKRTQENPRVMADFATKVDAAIAAMQDERNITPDRRDSASRDLQNLRTIRAAIENGTPEDVAKVLKDTGLIIGNYASYDEYSDISQARAAEGQRSNRRTTRSNPFGSRVETQLNEDGSANNKTEVRGTTQASDEGGAVYGKIGGIDMTEHETFRPLPLVSGALERVEATQKAKPKPDYTKTRKVESTLPRYADNDFYDPAKRKEMIALIKKQSARAKKESKKTDKADIKPRLLEFAKNADAIRKRLESGDRDAISVASVAVGNSKFNFGFDTQERIDHGKIGLTVDDILSGKKASIDINNPSELFDINRQSVQKLFGAKSRVTENKDGSFNVRVPSGVTIQITSSGNVMMSPEAVEMTWGKEMADRVRRGDAAVVGSFDIGRGIPLIELSHGIATNFTANHELFHAAAALAITPEQMRTLRQRFGGRDLTDAQIEERIANGYAQWREGRLQPTSTIRAIFRRIADFFSGVRSMFTGENFEDVFRNIESGRIWEQGGSQPSSFRRPLLIGRQGAESLDTSEGNNSRREALATAQRMEVDGREPREIWLTTGWEHDPVDGRWKMEILDSPEMAAGVKEMRPGEIRKLNEVFDNPKLYDAYPEFSDINVEVRNAEPHIAGGYRIDDNTLVINANSPDWNNPATTIVHELQHAIQMREGFDVGDSPRRIKTYLEQQNLPITQDEMAQYAREAYHNRGGEVEARNVERRLERDYEARRATPPSETRDTALEDTWTRGMEELYFRDRIREPDYGSEEPRPDFFSYADESVASPSEQPGVSGVLERVHEGSGVRGESSPGEASRLDRSADTRSSESDELQLASTSQPTRRPSIVTNSEEARREGERVVSEGQKTVSRLDQYLEPNGGTGIGQRFLDAVVPLVFNANRMVGRLLGWDVFDRLERGLATSPGKAVYKIEHGDAEAGVKGFGEILGDIRAEDRNEFETIAAYYNLRDIAGDRRLLMEQRERYKALASDEKLNAEIISRDLRKNRAIYSGEEIRQYEDAAAGSRKLADEYMKQAAEIQKVLDHKQTAKTAAWYDAEINKALAAHPEWEPKIQELIKWGQYQLQQFVDMGVVSEEKAAKARSAHPNYIPLMRNEESNLFESLDQTAKRYQQGVLDMADPLKRYTGGSEASLASPVEQLVNMQYRIESMKARQDVLSMVADGVESGRYGDLFRRINNDEELQRGEVALSIYRNGEKITYAVDEAVRALIDAHNPQQPTKLDRILRIPGTILREGVTRSPSFAISNALRDTFTASLLNPEVRPVIDTVRGLMSVLAHDEKFDDFLKHGGDQQMRWSTRDQRRQNAQNLYKKPETVTNPKAIGRHAWDFLGSLAEKSELATRVGTYMRLVESGVSPDEAAFRTINTMWFGRGGTASKSQYGRNIPFFNAALQGTYSLGRAFSKDGHFQWNPKVAMNGLLYLTIPSMLLTLWNLGDDDRREKYLEIPEQQKNTNWNVVLGDTILKLPKPHAPGIVFSSLAERFMDYLYANDRRAFDGLVGSLVDSIGPDMTPSFMRLPFELAMNKSLFYQRDIVPASELRYAPIDQYGPYTSDTARWMANAIYKGTSPILNLLGEDGWQVSPRKIEYAINQLTGNLGRDTLAKLDAGVRVAEGTERPTTEWHQNWGLPRRFLSSPENMRRTENDFREGLEAALADANSAALHAKERPRSELPERERRALGAKNAIQQLQTKELRAITTLRKEIREIASDKRMDGDRKRRLMDIREAKIRRISEEGLRKLDRIRNR